MLDEVQHVMLVLSGKGGVGKSTVSTQITFALAAKGYKVGILDIDLCGPSIPYLMGLENSDVLENNDGWLPVKCNYSNISVMSIGFLVKNKNKAVIWRGPKKTAIIKQLINDVLWGKLDYLIIDTPPGTSDEHITVMECMRDVKCDGAVIVTTAQQVALDDVRKEITFCKKTNIPLIGIIENMSGLICQHCNECTNIFSSGGGASLANLINVPLLATIPIEPLIGEISEKCISIIDKLPNSKSAKAFKAIMEQLINKKTD